MHILISSRVINQISNDQIPLQRCYLNSTKQKTHFFFKDTSIDIEQSIFWTMVVR